MTTYKESDLVNHVWKPCKDCLGKSEIFDINCNRCDSRGNEPVEMENPDYTCGDKDCTLNHPNYKHQVGVAFPVDDLEILENPEDIMNPLVRICERKFLPLHQKVEGDNSILMVVKNG